MELTVIITSYEVFEWNARREMSRRLQAVRMLFPIPGGRVCFDTINKQPAQGMPLICPKFAYLMMETLRSMSGRPMQASFNIYSKLHSKRRGKHSAHDENSKQTSAALATTARWRRADFGER